MSLGNPTNIVIIALLGIAALLFIIASFTGGGKWRRLYEQEADEYAAYADRADQDLRAARQRIAELERAHSALQQRHAEAEATIAHAEVAAPAAIAPVPTASPEPQPIVGERATITELPPAPIMGVTPLRAEEPVDAEFIPAQEAVIDATPVAVEVAPAVTEATPVAVEAVAPAPTEGTEEPAKAWFGAGKRDDLTRMRGVDALMNTRLFGLGVTTYDDIVQLSQEDEMALEQRLGVPAGYITRAQWREQASLLRFGKDNEFNERFGKVEV
jgi:predicted flap endonuclease-1-like 5' DNA nuclease